MIMKNTIKIKHSIPERIRFKVNAIRFNEAASLRLAEQTKAVNGVTWAGTNSKSASLIVRYDQQILTKADLIESVRTFIPQPETTRPAKNINLLSREVRGTSLKSSLFHFIGLSVLTVILFIREVVLKRPLAQNFFSPLGLITAVSALPLLKKGLENLKEGRFTLESFLGGCIITAVIAGEAAAALEILWITSGGTLLQVWITERSRRAIRDILQVTEKNTYILIEGVEIEVPVEEVNPGDIVVLHTGEKISVDGKITDGEAIVDESPISGRSEPAARYPGDKVFAGTFVRQGVIYVEAEKVGDKTYLARILRMVEESLENKAPIEGVGEQLAQNLIKAGFGVTLATLLITRSFWRAFTVMLVMACPCATILSASTAISAALSAAARRHILIKGGRYLEEAGQADVVCFDKTGTLTTNEPEIREFINLTDMPEEDLLQLAYSAEMHNSHPVALAIKAEAQKREVEPITHDVCEYLLGKGVKSKIHGEEILVGSGKLMKQFFINTDAVRQSLEDFQNQGLTTIFIVKERQILGVMGFANQDRPDIEAVVRYLTHDGIKEIAMVTGDEKYSARDLADKLKLSKCFYSVMPQEKAEIIAELKKNGHKVLMVGDGINDALALAEADIGMAMGAGGSEVAIEAADIALVKDDLKGAVYVRSLSHATIDVVHQNFWIATGSNIVGVVLGGLGILSPVMAGLIHITHTLGILLNSSRLLFYESPPLLPEKTQLPASETE